MKIREGAMNDNFSDALAELDTNIKGLEESAKWAVDEITRLRAENLELELKVKNLTYMLKTVTQGTLQ